MIVGLSGEADPAEGKNSIGNAHGKIDLDDLVHCTRRRAGGLTHNAQTVQDSGALNVVVTHLRDTPRARQGGGFGD